MSAAGLQTLYMAIAAIAAWTTFGSSIQEQATGSATTIGGLPR